MKTMLLIAAAVLVTLTTSPSLLAQSGGGYDLSWSTIDGGGGTSAGGSYSITGTIGQPDASFAMAGGKYSVTGGFWSLYAVLPSSGTPSLTIARSGANVTFSWPSPSTGYQLEETTTLAGTPWTTVNNTPTDNGATKSVTLPVQAGERYFRLHKP